MSHEPNSKSVRRIVLPSGRTIEVVRPAPSQPAPAEGLHVCPECGSHLVQPVEWGEGNSGSWEMTLECPNCHWLTEDMFSRDQVDRFEEQLDEGLADMLSDLRRMTQANMAEDIDRFVRALATDLILPEDF
jgi:hypothetical protein